ncbi:MAG TPA: PilZ domain-containing protein [Myxococcaceae bacterium]|nr:PilZ domain-containing protein [Myxococcaceae bacterium]
MPPSPTADRSTVRYHPRVDANFMVKVTVDGRTLLAKARDLSMAGLFLYGAESVRGSRVVLAIPLPKDREVVSPCRVARRHSQGLALEFDGLDWDDLLALARYLHPRLP